MSQNFVSQGQVCANKAIEADQAGLESFDRTRLQIAIKNYGSAAKYFETAIKYQTNPNLTPILREKSLEYANRAQYLSEQLKSNENPPQPQGGNAGTGAAAKKDKNEKDNESDKMRETLASAIVREKPNVKWEDVAGLDGAKDALKEAVILPLKFPNLFTGKRKPWKGILMYGPPGTGKSFLAKAVATEANSEFFSVSSADLVSKWQGESEKLVRELFKMARENKPSIIFVDEIDSLASARSDSESESARRIKTEFLVQMQGVGNSSDGVLVLGATNIPWGLDSAIRRRFERRIYIPLPDIKARTKMFSLNLGNTPHDLTDTDFQRLGAKSEGYSGSDISVLVRDAIMMPVRTLQSAQYFKRVHEWENGIQKAYVTPCSAGDPDQSKFAASLLEINPEELLVPKVTYYDFERAMAKSKPSVSGSDLADHEKFTAEFGQEGN
eukprot:Plantae.Rhodophyta-Purpureofilum_apyrenoidigerum.ctg6271.p1 GENE.Plantae.Rhodophyta-Purpureofilum_apyrenoidigerum.ctg6271~~Plantae.Rhodophyta-Purpureofilum_apyrenoidigerum.ctg6271.p1  ORF type:complete len:441 (-),score=92.54 Plantae.Rhodophyta-Purpureofilum_apyrenoidigerum.ctg6271:197-1519(-)